MLPHHRERINFYLRNYLWEHRTEKNRNGFYEKVYGKMYAAKTDDRSELRLHRNCWDEFLEKSGIPLTELDISTKEIPKGVDVVYNVPKGFKLRDYQEKVIESVKQPNRTSVIEMPPGFGKMSALTDDVRVPNGWVKMNRIKEGSLISSPNGDTEIVTDIYDHPDSLCYRVYFEDGRFNTVGGPHLWEVYCDSWGEYRTVTTDQLIDDLGSDEEFYIPLVDPIHSADRDTDVPIDPYVIGVVSEYGRFDSLNQFVVPKFNNISDEVLLLLRESIGKDILFEDLGSDILIRDWDVYQNIVKLDTTWLNKNHNLIEYKYLELSFNQRLSLIQGILDTNKSVRLMDDAIKFEVSSVLRVGQLVDILRSVGCVVYPMKSDDKITVVVKAQIPSLLFRNNPIKSETDKIISYGLRLRIDRIEESGYQDARCIRVSHPDQLYITNDYIVTHNTSTSLSFIASQKKRLGIVVLGRYTERWWQDVTQYANQSEILEIRGTKDLAMTIESAYLDPDYLKDIKIIMITTTTLQDYISFYEKSKPEERKNLLPPEEIWEVLGIGIKLCDEAHQHFHANFMIDLYTHIEKEIFLSGTLNVADSFLKRMYEILYPKMVRAGGGIQKKYTTCTSVRYRFKEPYKIKCKNQKKMYNHTRFEKWLMSSPRLYKRYFEVVIDPLIKSDFIPRREGKYKALVFFATTKMCGLYVEHLKSNYPDLDIRRYISEDSYDNLLKADIAVSTLGSAGTAVDIKDLITCIMTTALKSEQANLQALGRLREIPGVKTDFFYLVCDDIPKHVSYHETKKWLFRSWVKSHDDYYVGDRV